MRNQEHTITNTKAYVDGFNKGHALCIHQKKLTSMTASLIKTLSGNIFENDFTIGLHDGYQEGFKSMKKELVKQRQKEFEVLHQDKERTHERDID